MSLISMVEARLPPGFRFHPRDDELVLDYLWHKLSGNVGGRHSCGGGGGNSFCGCTMMVDVDLNNCEPWDLPETARVGGKEWYFFSLRDRKYASGLRTNRATQSGYWKATGKDRPVRRRAAVVGMRKTLVFYQGRAPKGKKTEWVMHEFRMEGQMVVGPPRFPLKEDWVLCRVFYKSRGANPKPATGEHGSLEPGSAPALWPPTDTYIAFDHAPPAAEGYEQVPCFSGLPTGPPALPLPMPLPFKNSVSFGDLLDFGSCDKKPIKTAIRSNMTSNMTSNMASNKVESNHLESYMPGNGMSHVWNPF